MRVRASWFEAKYDICEEAKVWANLDTISEQFCTVRWSVNLYFWNKCVQYIQNTINKAEIEKIENNHKGIDVEGHREL